jgi:hypothetical protein
LVIWQFMLETCLPKFCWNRKCRKCVPHTMNHCFNQCPGSWSAWPKASRLHTLAAWQHNWSSASRWMIWRDMTWLYEMWFYTIWCMDVYGCVWYTMIYHDIPCINNECDWTW